MIHKLWIDDIRPAPNDEWILAKTVTEAIRMIDELFLDEISLDHDISHQIMMENSAHGSVCSRPYPCGETFEPVARFIAALARRNDVIFPFPIKINIHTANPAGAEKMKQILMRAGIEPTITLGVPCKRKK